MNPRGILGVLLALGMGIHLAAFQSPRETVTLQLKWHHQFQFAGYYAAQEKGYYRSEGLEVNLVEGGPGIDAIQEVTSGRAQYGVGNSALLLARQKGDPVVALAAVFQHSPLILMAKADAGIASVHDLAGKRLMIEPRADELIAYLRKEGVPENTMTLLKHSFNPEDLITGKVDCISAYVTDEPYFLTRAHQEALEFSPRMGGIDFYGDNLFTSETELKAHPTRVKAFREASLKGWNYAMQHPEEIADLIIRRYGKGRGRDYLLYEAQKMVPLVHPGLMEMGYMYPGRWQHIIDTYAGLGLLPQGFKLDGFLYDPEAGARQDYRRLAAALVIVLAMGGLLGGLALLFLRLNLRLKGEIASREKAEGDRAGLQAQLLQAQKMESLGSLAGGVAHDMNNVLGAILGMASATIELQPEGSQARHAFATIIKAAERGGKMVRGLLSFARVSPAEEQVLDVNAILQEEVQLLERTTLAKVHLVIDLRPDLHPILGDASSLNHAFMNICVNAVDAMPGNGTLKVSTRNIDDDWIEVRVDDTGDGMSKEILERAMDPFFTTKPQGKGTGLGLSMVYSTVKAHQGQMEILSEPGRGTSVRMRFKSCESQDPAQEPVHAPNPAQDALSVFVVDDDELIRSSMQAVLEELGHVSAEASSGEEALLKLTTGYRPDVVIMDMNMPGLGGSGTLPRLRALDPLVPVLLATGRADQTALDLVEAHSNVTLLSKPFTMRELQTRLEVIAKTNITS